MAGDSATLGRVTRPYKNWKEAPFIPACGFEAEPALGRFRRSE